MQLSRSIVPIFEYEEGGKWGGFLGTGTFVGDPPILVTAYHVLRDHGPDFAVVLPPSPIKWGVNAFGADMLRFDEAFDLALLAVQGYVPPNAFILADETEIANNVPVLCYEFGTTTRVASVDHLAPATRMGNVTRVIDLSEQFGPAGLQALELS